MVHDHGLDALSATQLAQFADATGVGGVDQHQSADLAHVDQAQPDDGQVSPREGATNSRTLGLSDPVNTMRASG